MHLLGKRCIGDSDNLAPVEMTGVEPLRLFGAGRTGERALVGLARHVNCASPAELAELAHFQARIAIVCLETREDAIELGIPRSALDPAVTTKPVLRFYLI